MSLSNPTLRYLAAIIVGFAIGFTLYAVGPDAHNLDPAVQAIALASLGLVVATVGVILGSTISAEATRQAAVSDRENADHAREAIERDAALDREQRYELSLFELKIPQIRTLLETGDEHMHELAQQVAIRQEIAALGGDPDEIPTLGKTDRMEATIVPLYAFADQATGDAARELFVHVIGSNRFAYNAAMHRSGKAAKGLANAEMLAHEKFQRDYVILRTSFLNAVRAELHRPLLK